jgi:2-deoxy-D-gluconate 3-dehydrogenase
VWLYWGRRWSIFLRAVLAGYGRLAGRSRDNLRLRFVSAAPRRIPGGPHLDLLALLLRYQARAERLYRRALEDFQRLKRLRSELPAQPGIETEAKENLATAKSRTEPCTLALEPRRAIQPKTAASLTRPRRRVTHCRIQSIFAGRCVRWPGRSQFPKGASSVPANYSAFGLEDKIAVVTGASQGIGRAIALGLAEAGAHIVLAKHPEGRHEEIRQVRDEIEKLRRKAEIVITDVADVESVRALMETAKEDFGRVDILVNNAGWTGNTLALEVTEDEYDRTMNASVKSVFFACQAAARIMIPQGGGRIVNIGSNFGEVAFKSRSVYAAAKAAVHHLSRALSLEWANQGVTVNVVAPCITETDSRRVILERPGYKEWATTQMLPAGRWNQPRDIVGAVLFLASPFAEMIVGHVLMVDGGWTIH